MKGHKREDRGNVINAGNQKITEEEKQACYGRALNSSRFSSIWGLLLIFGSFESLFSTAAHAVEIQVQAQEPLGVFAPFAEKIRIVCFVVHLNPPDFIAAFDLQ